MKYASSALNRKPSFYSFPWKAIQGTIDLRDLSYNLSKPAQNLFRNRVKRSPDLCSDISYPPPYIADSATNAADYTSTQPSSYGSATLNKVVPNSLSQVQISEAFTSISHDLLWIRSPALKGSLARSLQAYRALFTSKSPVDFSTIANTRFDVALACYTHRLNPSSYRRYLPNTTSTLAPPEKTASPWPSRPPSNLPCFCWTHEAITSTLSSYGYSSLHQLSHKQIEQVKIDIGFHRAVEAARLEGRRLPARMTSADAKDKMKEVWEAEYGLDYYVKVMPAVYDGHGNLKRAEERKMKKRKGYTNGFNWMIAL